MEIVVFAAHTWENSGMSYCVENAFDLHRQRLVTIMERMGTIAQQMELTDDHYSDLFKPVHNRFIHVAKSLPEYWEQNELVLRQLIQPLDLPLTYTILPPMDSTRDSSEYKSASDRKAERDAAKDLSPYNSLVQVIVHLTRDWTAQGSTVRKILYHDGIIRFLRTHLPPNLDTDSPPHHVLVPGAGMGRLAFDLVIAGYRVEANECSAVMLCATYTLLTHLVAQGKSLPLYPHLHFQLQDDWDVQSKLLRTTFPYLEDSVLPPLDQLTAKLSAHLTLQYGDFVGLYGAQRVNPFLRFDAVVTCYFLDTSNNILDYIQTIRNVLADDGVWVNTGPLHYHSQHAVPYSYRDVLEIIQRMGFEVLQQEILFTGYCGEEEVSMKPEVYRTPIAAFRKKRTWTGETSSDGEIGVVNDKLCHPDYILRR